MSANNSLNFSSDSLHVFALKEVFRWHAGGDGSMSGVVEYFSNVIIPCHHHQGLQRETT